MKSRLSLIRETDRHKGHAYALYLCECGNTKELRISSVKTGNTLSCGCYRKESHVSKKHGKYGTKIYKVWANMKNRCFNSNVTNYQDYGGRGITVCDRWLKFENFYEDMGDCPEGMSIERINVDGNYMLSNCRWATDTEQARNRRSNRLVNIEGVTKCLSEWAEIYDIDYHLVMGRINKLEWDVITALTSPLRVNQHG